VFAFLRVVVARTHPHESARKIFMARPLEDEKNFQRNLQKNFQHPKWLLKIRALKTIL
jgi:hypothetical protein